VRRDRRAPICRSRNRPVRLFAELRHQCLQRFLDRAEHADFERTAVAESFGTDIDLRDLGVFGEELPVRKISAENEEDVATLHPL
jgi:hypothetical protein